MNKDQFCQVVIAAGLLRDLGRDDSHFAAYSSEFDDGVLRYARELYVDGDQAMKTAEADARISGLPFIPKINGGVKIAHPFVDIPGSIVLWAYKVSESWKGRAFIQSHVDTLHFPDDPLDVNRFPEEWEVFVSDHIPSLRLVHRVIYPHNTTTETYILPKEITLTRYWHDSALDSRNVTTE